MLYPFFLYVRCNSNFSTWGKDLPLAATWPQPQSNMNETTRLPHSELPPCITNEQKHFGIYTPQKEARNGTYKNLVEVGEDIFLFLLLVRDITYPPGERFHIPPLEKGTSSTQTIAIGVNYVRFPGGWYHFPAHFLKKNIRAVFHTKTKILGGGFKYNFHFHPNLGKIPILTNIFQMGWNHQLENQHKNCRWKKPSGSGDFLRDLWMPCTFRISSGVESSFQVSKWIITMISKSPK